MRVNVGGAEDPTIGTYGITLTVRTTSSMRTYALSVVAREDGWTYIV